ncbi:LAME_0C06304g1_1 [Lachancea meyersii CBS 8951]|uniref:LAME_0C06304g1_1 n=1 Tax=Lachancea meyersii CBS 8951 TaxID=1266667 RepID=A0A1G4J229_9SACH|nr:LAME_0C06304g1_1 [Lachancea meyersii CBS 8951]
MRYTYALRNGARMTSLDSDVRQKLIAQCLNLEFDKLLKTVKSLPLDILDESFLHLFLAKSVQHAHTTSIDFLWYRFVMGRKVLAVRPSLLCAIGTVALNDNKPFLPAQLCAHFDFFYGREPGLEELRNELLRIKVESFAKTTKRSTSFREKWKVFLQDIDSVVSPAYELRVRDFPHLTQALRHAEPELLEQLLFSENKIAIKNDCTLPLLLNMTLMQDGLDPDFKIRMFCGFRDSHRTLDYNDSISILLHTLKGDLYRSSKLMQYLTKHHLTIPPLGARCFLATTNMK